MELAIIVPTRNEEEVVDKFIQSLVESMEGSGIDYKVVFVDDSTDGTVGRLKEISREMDNVIVIHRSPDASGLVREHNFITVPLLRRGLSGAVIDAFEMINARRYIVMDVDLQHPPEYVPKLYSVLDKCDFVIGSRYVPGGKIEGWSLYRHLVSRSFILAARMILGSKSRGMKDLTSGFFGVRESVIKRCTEKLDPIGWKIMLEVLVKCNPKNVCEVPITFRERVAGTSKAGVKVAIDGFKHIIKLRKYGG